MPSEMPSSDDADHRYGAADPQATPKQADTVDEDDPHKLEMLAAAERCEDMNADSK